MRMEQARREMTKAPNSGLSAYLLRRLELFMSRASKSFATMSPSAA